MEQIINWPRAIQTNIQALRQVAAEIFALLEYAVTGTATIWPHEIQAQARRLLRPAESAVRRLIIIMARDVSVKLPPSKPMPKGLAIKASADRKMRFRLYDSRKRFRSLDVAQDQDRSGPRIRFVFERGPLVPAMLLQKPKVNRAENLRRRFDALKLALETLPQQAKRLAHWRLRRAQKANVKFTSPLRPGRPPGHQRRPLFEIDFILDALHGLAFDVLSANSS